MKRLSRLSALPAIIALSVCATACGGDSSSAASRGSSSAVASGRGAVTEASRPTSSGGYVRGDDDEDDDTYDYWDDHLIRDYGHVASAVVRRAVTSVVMRYFATANAENGTTACSLMYSRLAKATNFAKAVPQDYEPYPGSSFSRDKHCSQFMSQLFKEVHEQLSVADIPTLEVTAVRVNGSHGLALLAFKTTPERWIAVRREHGAWKIDGLLDSEIP